MRPRGLAPACIALLISGGALAQQKPAAPGFPEAPGKEVLLKKCFQCHAPAMWMDQRQDRRAWESTLYRMVGRGALWSEDEIKAMADYLGAVYVRKAQ
jgi:cytochrome c5